MYKKVFTAVVIVSIVLLVLLRSGIIDNGIQISSIQPSETMPGEEIFIMGSGFGIALDEVAVLFGERSVKALEVRDDQIKVRVPEGAQSGLLSVAVGGDVSNGVFLRIGGAGTVAMPPHGMPSMNAEPGAKKQVAPPGMEGTNDNPDPQMRMGGMMTSHAFYSSKDAKPAPDFALKNEKGETVKLADYKGRTLVLNFWATWCAPCLAEIPSLESLTKRAEAADFDVLAVSVNQSFDEIKRDLPNCGLKVVLDPKSETAASYGTSKFPETYVIDREGRIVAKFIGAQNWDSEAFAKLLQMVSKGTLPGDMMVEEH